MTTNVPLKFQALDAMPAPADVTPATHYYVEQPDGGRELYLSDAEPPYTLRRVGGLMTSGSLGRTGAVTNRLTKNSTTLAHQFTNTSGAPIVLSSVTIEGLTLSAGTAELTVWSQSGQLLASAPATAQNGGLTAPLAYTIPAGAIVLIGAVSTGGYLTAALSSGHTWPGLTMSNVGLYTSISVVQGGIVSEDNGAPTAQLRFQFGTGGEAIRRIEADGPLTTTVQGGTLRLGVGLIDLSGTGQDATDTLPHGSDALIGYRLPPGTGTVFEVLQPRRLTGHTQAWSNLEALALYRNGTLVREWTGLGGLPDSVTLHDLPLSAALDLNPGDTLEYRVTAVTLIDSTHVGAAMGGNRMAPLDSTGTAPMTTTGGTLHWENGYSDGWHAEWQFETGLVTGVLPEAHVGGLAEVKARVTALEARPVWTQEAFEDAVGAMLPQGTYNDETGKISFTFATPRTDEEIQDIVAALIQAGANVTTTYDDAGNVLTISATGGGGGPGGGTDLAAYVAKAEVGVTRPGTANFALNRPYVSHAPASNNPDAGGTQITDGVLATAPQYNDPAFVMYQNVDASWTIDLGLIRAVQVVEGRFLRQTGVGVHLPVALAVTTSLDGVTFTPYVQQVIVASDHADEAVHTLSAAGDAPVNARYVHVTAPRGGEWTAVDDVSVSGGVFRVDVTALNAAGTPAVNTVLRGDARWEVMPRHTVGTTAERPAAPAVGDVHSDTTLGKPVWWFGAWKDATGANA